MRPGGDIDSVQPGAPLHPEAVPIVLDLDPCRAELQDQGSQVGRLGLLQDRLPAGCRDRDRVGTRLDVVRDDPVGRAAELGDAFDLQDVSADPPDAGTHPSQEHRQVHHVRLARCVVDGGHAVGHGRGHHQVLGAGHSRHVQVDGGASQTVGSGDVFAVLQLHRFFSRGPAVDPRLESVVTRWKPLQSKVSSCVCHHKMRSIQNQN